MKWQEKPIDPIRFLRVWGFTPQLVALFGNNGNVRLWVYLPEGRNLCPPLKEALCFLLHCGNSYHLTLLVLPMDQASGHAFPAVMGPPLELCSDQCLPGCDGLTSKAVLRPVAIPSPLWWTHLWSCNQTSVCAFPAVMDSPLKLYSETELSSIVLSVRYFSDSDEKSYQNIHNLTGCKDRKSENDSTPNFLVHKILSWLWETWQNWAIWASY